MRLFGKPLWQRRVAMGGASRPKRPLAADRCGRALPTTVPDGPGARPVGMLIYFLETGELSRPSLNVHGRQSNFANQSATYPNPTCRKRRLNP